MDAPGRHVKSYFADVELDQRARNIALGGDHAADRFHRPGRDGQAHSPPPVSAGYPMTVCDLDAASSPSSWRRERALPPPRRVAAESDVVISIVPDAPDVEAVALGIGGLIEGVRPGMIYVDMSTIDPGRPGELAPA